MITINTSCQWIIYSRTQANHPLPTLIFRVIVIVFWRQKSSFCRFIYYWYKNIPFDDICILQDQHVEWELYCTNSLKQQIAGTCRSSHIQYSESKLRVFGITLSRRILCSISTILILQFVFCLTRQGIRPSNHHTLNDLYITPKIRLYIAHWISLVEW